MPTYDTSTGFRALEGTNPISEVDAGFLALAADVKAAIDALVPTGSMIATGRSSAPTGWLLCDGTAVSRSTYAALFTAIGTAFGTGNGSTTFNVPDLRGRTAIGVDGSAGRLVASLDALGQSGGEEAHTLTAASLPAHTHSVTTNHVGSGDGSGISTSNLGTSGFSGTTNNNSGGGGAHNNMQPYQVVNWIVKI